MIDMKQVCFDSHLEEFLVPLTLFSKLESVYFSRENVSIVVLVIGHIHLCYIVGFGKFYS